MDLKWKQEHLSPFIGLTYRIIGNKTVLYVYQIEERVDKNGGY
jgi:hypothetical protein